MSVHELLRSHTSEEITEWIAYFELEQESAKKPSQENPIDKQTIGDNFRRLARKKKK